MFNKFIILNTYVVFYLLILTQIFQKSLQLDLDNKIIYAHNNITSLDNYYEYVYVYNKNNIRSKKELLKDKNLYYVSYYCRNDTCIYVDNNYNKNFIEFPDEHGNINLYITNTFS